MLHLSSYLESEIFRYEMHYLGLIVIFPNKSGFVKLIYWCKTINYGMHYLGMACLHINKNSIVVQLPNIYEREREREKKRA